MARRAVEDLGRGLLIIGETDGADHQPMLKIRQAPPRPQLKAVPKAVPTKAAKTSVAGHFGRRLREAREARGLSRTDIAKALKFTTSQIEALEEGELRHMAPVYATGFVRCYAQYLGEKALGATVSETVAAFRAEHAQGAGEAEKHAGPVGLTPPRRRFRLPAVSVVLAVFALAIAIYAAWHFFKDPVANAQTFAEADDYHGALLDISQYRLER